jgi:hypothetical protein
MATNTFMNAMQSSLYNRYGITIPPTAHVAAFLHADGVRDGDDSFIKNNTVKTLNKALARCKSDRQDYIFALPGHTENVASADAMDSLVAGTQIVGIGDGAGRPAFTWSAAASTFLFDVANVGLHNCILNLEPGTGTVTVAAPITVSGAGCAITGCLMRFSTDANNKVTQGFTVTGDDFRFENNICYGATAGECTAFMDLNAAHRAVLIGNYIAGATSNVAVGLVRFVTAASLNVYLKDNVYINRKALSTCCVTGLAAVSGISINESFNYLDTASLTPWLTSTGIMHFHRPSVTNTAGETGSEVVGTVSA